MHKAAESQTGLVTVLQNNGLGITVSYQLKETTN